MAFDHAAPAETEDPRLALQARSIHARCAGARDLSRFGTVADIPALIELAQQDRSPAVRLGAAGAVADILSRHRLGSRRKQLDEPSRRAIFDQFKGIDPSLNAGLFSMLACIGIPEGFARIASGLRDPRGDVRLGAAIGLLRLCESAAAFGDAELERGVAEILRDPRLKPDAAAEVSWVAARVGFQSLRPLVQGLALTGAQGELCQKALELFEANERPLAGAFVSDGRDAGEIDPSPVGSAGFAAFGPGGALMDEGGDEPAWTFVNGFLPRSIRRMRLRRVGEVAPVEAFQLAGRTWYAASEAQLVAAVEAHLGLDSLAIEAPSEPGPVETHALEILGPLLPADGWGDLARGQLALRAGQPDSALAFLLASADAKKKPQLDARYFAGAILMAQGQPEAAREQLEAFLRKARKRDPRRERAEALIAGA